jgi:bacterioferritin (cytochrome b1)
VEQLTQKELLALETLLQTEQLLIEKYKLYAQMCDDPQLMAKCEQLAGKHQNHYDRLIACLG